VMRRALRAQPSLGFSVRPARAGDRQRMLEVWERSVRATHEFLSDSDVIGLKPLVAAELQSDAIAWWVLEAADTVVGLLGFANDTVEALFIDPDHRGLGGGTLLVEHAQRLAHGSLAVDVNEQNETARRFYESLRFVVVDRSPTDSGGRPFPILHMKRMA